jgi:hypothetical protein
VLECSEIGDDRPLSGCSFSRDASMLATRYFLVNHIELPVFFFLSCMLPTYLFGFLGLCLLIFIHAYLNS